MARFVRAAAAILFVGAGGAALGSVAACETLTDTTAIAPVTGIVVRADTITTGRGCGTAPTQVLKYAVAVYQSTLPDGAPGGFVGAGIYDCFSDAVFFDLSTADTSVFAVHVFAYNSADYDAARVADAIVPPAPDAGGPDPLTKLGLTHPTWTTDCSATQQSNIEVLAVCGPLGTTSGPGSVSLDVSSFDVGNGGDAGADGGTLLCGDLYSQVNVAWDTGGLGPSGSFPVAECIGAKPFVVAVPTTPMVVTFHVGLLTGTGASVGTVTCSGAATGGDAGAAAAGNCHYTAP